MAFASISWGRYRTTLSTYNHYCSWITQNHSLQVLQNHIYIVVYKQVGLSPLIAQATCSFSHPTIQKCHVFFKYQFSYCASFAFSAVQKVRASTHSSGNPSFVMSHRILTPHRHLLQVSGNGWPRSWLSKMWKAQQCINFSRKLKFWDLLRTREMWFAPRCH